MAGGIAGALGGSISIGGKIGGGVGGSVGGGAGGGIGGGGPGLGGPGPGAGGSGPGTAGTGPNPKPAFPGLSTYLGTDRELPLSEAPDAEAEDSEEEAALAEDEEEEDLVLPDDEAAGSRDEADCLESGESAEVSTGDSLRITTVTDTLETKLKKDFIVRLKALAGGYPKEVRRALTTIYGDSMTPEIADDILGQTDAASSTLLPAKVYVADGLFLRGANGCYVREKRWVFLRADLAEKVFAEQGLSFARAEIADIVFDAEVPFGSDNPYDDEDDIGIPVLSYPRSADLYEPDDPDPYAALFATFCEEVGHHLDEYVGMVRDEIYHDAPGDEGELFALLLGEGLKRLDAGEPLFTEDEIMHARRDNDVGYATIKTEAGEEKDCPVEFQRQSPPNVNPPAKVYFMVMYLVEPRKVDFHTNKGRFRYSLEEISGIPEGEYDINVVKMGKDPKHPEADTIQFNGFKIPGNKEEYKSAVFKYRISPGQPNPDTFFAARDTVHVTVVNSAAAPLEPPRWPAGEDGVVMDDAMEQCNLGNCPGIKVFPYRGTRLGGAPLFAYRDKDGDVVVKYPLYVKFNKDFKKQTDTFKSEQDPWGEAPFMQGIRLKPNEIVRVHIYEPRWWDQNITGDTKGWIVDDVETEICATADDMLELSARSHREMLWNVAFTGVDALTTVLPVGKLLEPLTKPLAQSGSRAARILVTSILMGLERADFLPGAATRATVALVEYSAVKQVAGHAVSEGIADVAIDFSKDAATRAAREVVIDGLRDSAAKGAAGAVSRTIIINVVNRAGKELTEKIVTPTGDRELDEAIERAFAPHPGTLAPHPTGSGVVAQAPEIVGGLTHAQVDGFRKLTGKSITSGPISLLGRLWEQVANAGEKSRLTRDNVASLFKNQRKRFWEKVFDTPEAMNLIGEAGWRIPKRGNVPVFNFAGQEIRITMDHILEKQTVPSLGLDAANLRLCTTLENTVLLRQLTDQDIFQHAAEIERATREGMLQSVLAPNMSVANDID